MADDRQLSLLLDPAPANAARTVAVIERAREPSETDAPARQPKVGPPHQSQARTQAQNSTQLQPQSQVRSTVQAQSNAPQAPTAPPEPPEVDHVPQRGSESVRGTASADRGPSTRSAAGGQIAANASEAKPTAVAAPSPARVPRSRLLANALEEALGPHRLKITDNRSTLLSTSHRKGVLTVRVHQLFLNGNAALFADIGQYFRSGEKAAGARIDAFIKAHDHLLDHHVRELAPDAHLGAHHDLLDVMRELNAQYFRPAIRADITWGAGSALKRKTSITLGTYDARAHRIQIHPALDQAWVPRLCVARVVHHEMLHAKHPAVEGDDGRRIVHGPAFLREEAAFHGAEQADVWFDLNLDRLLRYRPKRRKPRGSKP